MAREVHYATSSAQDAMAAVLYLQPKPQDKTMKRMKMVLLIAATACLGIGLSQAQDSNSSDNNNNNNNGGKRSRFSGGDPSQFRQMMMDRMKERLEVKDDAEWKALEPLIQKVMDVRRDLMGLSIGGFG